MGFLKFFKVGMCLFLTRIMMECENNIIIRFCIHKIEMAFETPFAPGGLHFYFGPSGVKCLMQADGHLQQNSNLLDTFLNIHFELRRQVYEHCILGNNFIFSRVALILSRPHLHTIITMVRLVQT